GRDLASKLCPSTVEQVYVCIMHTRHCHTPLQINDSCIRPDVVFDIPVLSGEHDSPTRNGKSLHPRPLIIYREKFTVLENAICRPSPSKVCNQSKDRSNKHSHQTCSSTRSILDIQTHSPGAWPKSRVEVGKHFVQNGDDSVFVVEIVDVERERDTF